MSAFGAEGILKAREWRDSDSPDKQRIGAAMLALIYCVNNDHDIRPALGELRDAMRAADSNNDAHLIALAELSEIALAALDGVKSLEAIDRNAPADLQAHDLDKAIREALSRADISAATLYDIAESVARYAPETMRQFAKPRGAKESASKSPNGTWSENIAIVALVFALTAFIYFIAN